MLCENKSLGDEPAASAEQTHFAVAMASHIGSFFSSAVSSAMSSTYSYFTTPAPFPPKSVNFRTTTNYKDNVVASISLPDRPKIKPKACSVTLPKSKAAATLFSPAPVLKKRKPGKNDIDFQMIELVKKIKLMGPHKDPKQVEDIYLQQINLLEQEIMEHAQRRVDLYFYLLVAVYKKNGRVVKMWTHKQHGVGGIKDRGTNACHDSFFPHVELQYQQTKISSLWARFVPPDSISGTHFEDSNNMTTELPIIVNEFDTYMESANPGKRSAPSKYVNKMLKDLNLVAKGEKTPVDAMNSFLKTMKLFFSEFEKKLDREEKLEIEEAHDFVEIEDHDEPVLLEIQEEKLESEKKFEDEEITDNDKKLKFPNAMHRAMRKIWELQKTATLRAQSDDTDSIDHTYLCTLLRVPPDQVLKTRQNPSLLLNYYCPIIQKEIFTTKSIIGEDRKIIKPAGI